MKKHLIISQLLCLIIFSSSQALATTLSLHPTSQNIKAGSTTTVDLNISNLGNYTPPSIGSFFTEITFDDSMLLLDSVTYSAFLGDPSDSFETDIVTTIGSGVVSLDEFSFLFDVELDALQPESFTLATLSFIGLVEGTSTMNFGIVDLSDAAFPANTILASLESSSITVTPAKVPLPPTFLLLASGLVSIVARPRNHRLRHEPS